MQENIYAAPSANLDDTHKTDVSNEFYIVSTRKFYALFLTTFGLYGVYWHYKNWKLYQQKHNLSMLPVMRGLFSIFFTHSLFRAIDKRIKDTGETFEWNPNNWASAVVITAIIANLSDKITSKIIDPIYTDFAALASVPLLAFLMFKAQKGINLGCNDPEGATNDRFTAWNILWISIGMIFVALVMIGLLLPEEYLE